MVDSSHPKRILIIEDEEQVRSVISAFLQAADFEVLQAENGKEGMEAAIANIPDLIICDVNMPVMDGYGVLANLRKDPVTAAIPFIFLTGKGDHTDLRQGMNLGADDYLIKPFRRADLLRAIETRLAKQAAITKRYTDELKLAEEKMMRLLHYDTLTNLPNRLMLREQLNKIILRVSPQQQIAILSLGLDRFKRISDTLGSRAGDDLLQMVGERLSKCVGANDTIAHLNADQFAMILSNVGHKSGANQVAQTLLDHLSAEPFILDGAGIFTTASIGITLYPTDGGDIDDLIKNAEAAMDHVKSNGGNGFEFFSPQLRVETAEELALEASLRYALERKQFEVYYQPQINLHTGQISGAEALIRWKHPEKGLVSPAQFIPIAEQAGLIIPLSEWVLRTACSQMRIWRDMGFSDLAVAVNVSGNHFGQQNLPERLMQILSETGLNPSALDIELTESILMKDVQSAVSMLNEIKGLGIQVSIDDFGTGYSSLSYLRRFPFNTLKIDQSFVRDLAADSKNAAITRAIIQMAHTLNLTVIAEGVETNTELEFLLQNKCDQMQGYLFSRPVPAPDFEKLLMFGKSLVIPQQI